MQNGKGNVWKNRLILYILKYILNFSKKLFRRLLTMAKFKCKLCGYTTEEFEELPEDFKCPMCGATADMFEKVE